MKIKKNNLTFLLLLISTSLSNHHNSMKIFQLPYLYIEDAYYCFFKITEDKETVILGFDLTSPFTRIAKEIYEIPIRNSTSIIGNVSLVLNDLITLNGVERKELIQLETNDSQLFISVVNTLAHSQFYGVNNVFAMGHKLASKTHSLTYLLQDKGLIDKASFSFYNYDETKGTLYFGGLPSIITDDGYYHVTCPVLGKENNWDCSLTHVFIGDISNVYENSYHQVRESAYFSSTQSLIEVPELFYKKLVSEMFNQTLEERRCIINKFSKSEIECQCNIIKDFKPVTFVIEGMAFRFTSEELFSKLDSICSFQIVNNVNGNNWVIGISFMKNYITTFDYDNQNVVFYSKEKFEKVDLDKLFPAKTMIQWVLIIGAILLLVIILKVIQGVMRKKKINRHKKAIEDVYQAFY